MSLKKKKITQEKKGVTNALPKVGKTMKTQNPGRKKDHQRAYEGIRRSFASLLDRTKAYLRPAEKVDV